MRRYAILFLFFVILSQLIVMPKVFAQSQRTVDSLLQKLETAPEDSLRFDMIDYLFLYHLNSDISKSKEFLKMEDELIKKLPFFKRGASACLINRGVIAQMEGDNVEALKYFLMTLKLNEEIGYNLTNAYMNVGVVYTELNDYETGLKYYFKALTRIRSLRRDKNNVDSTETTLARTLPGLYNDIGSDYFFLSDFKNALEYNFAAYKTAERMGDRISMAVAANMIGQSYFKLKQFDKALENYKNALKIANEVQSVLDILEANENIGNLYNATGKYEEALLSFQDAVQPMIMNDNKKYRLRIYKGIIESYEGLKDYKNKSIYQEKYQALNDSIYNETNSLQISRMKTKFATEEKEKENIILADENKIQLLELFGLGILLILTIALAWLFIKQNKAMAEQRSLVLEQKLLRSQMNPHFIFNSLASIESFIYENQPKEAGRYLSDFARLMRLILENSAEEYISLEKEIKTLEHYLVLQKLRLENGLEYKIEIDQSLDPGDVKIPPMLTQPFIENAIEHGFRGSLKTGEIIVSFTRDNDDLKVQVRDNGVGIDHASPTQKQKDHRSMAMQITKERLTALNHSKKHKMKFSVSDLSNQNSKGTMVTFSIPL